MNLRGLTVSLLAVVMLSGCQWLEKPSTPSASGVTSLANLAMPPDSPFGTLSDIRYAAQLWDALVLAQMVGAQAIPNEPFFGGAKPHGMILEIAQGFVAVKGHTGFVIVKKNYNGADVSVERVKQDRHHYLDSITVMYQREAHYDDDNQNWFWVKYTPDGSLFDKTVAKQRIALAGRLMKGKTAEQNTACLYCHSSAGGGDYIFYPIIAAPVQPLGPQIQ